MAVMSIFAMLLIGFMLTLCITMEVDHDVCTNVCVYVCSNTPTYRQTNIQTDRQTDRQTYSRTYVHAHIRTMLPLLFQWSGVYGTVFISECIPKLGQYDYAFVFHHAREVLAILVRFRGISHKGLMTIRFWLVIVCLHLVQLYTESTSFQSGRKPWDLSA